jgi:hypothetical protein
MAFIYSLTDTWADAGVTFTAIKMNVTDSASASGSLLMDLQSGGASRFRVTKNGQVTADQGVNFAAGSQTAIYAYLGNPGDFGIGVSSISSIGWHAAAPIATSTKDLTLFRDAADTLAQRRSTNAQAFRVYNTFTDASNYERLTTTWAASRAEIRPEAAGTGVVRNLLIEGGATSLGGILFSTGAETLGWEVQLTGGLATAPRRAGLYPPANNVLQLRGTTGAVGGAFSLIEMTAPAAPATNEVRIYAEDDGSGKTRLMARFATGAAVQIAIEP